MKPLGELDMVRIVEPGSPWFGRIGTIVFVYAGRIAFEVELPPTEGDPYPCKTVRRQWVRRVSRQA